MWQGFREFYDSGRFSDVTLLCEGKEFEVHRLILAFCSEYFAALLAQPGIGRRITLPDFQDPDHVFPDIVRYMYTGEVIISAEKAVPLLAMADQYQITELKTELSEYISKNVRRENCVTLLKKALQFHADKIVTRCIHVVANNFAYLYDVTYNFLPFPLFVKFINHKYLNVLREFDLFIHVKDYIAVHPQLSEDQKMQLLSAVRYRWFTTDELIGAMKEARVPQKLLLDATFARLQQFEPQPGYDEEALPLHLQSRPLYPVVIRFRPPENNNVAPGIVDWIGRAAGRREWQNPHLDGQVLVSASSLCKGVLQDLVTTAENELWSKDVPASWFSVDFGQNRSVIVSHYALRHGGNYRADSLRNWDLQGSTDGLRWEVLMSHRHDQSLQGPFAIAHWELPETRKAHRFFRVIQTGHNASSRNFLVLANIEFYGTVFDLTHASPQQLKSLHVK